MEAYLFSFHIMYKSQFRQIDPYDWFCGPGSFIIAYRVKSFRRIKSFVNQTNQFN